MTETSGIADACPGERGNIGAVTAFRFSDTTAAAVKDIGT
jgi:hypothetical protein